MANTEDTKEPLRQHKCYRHKEHGGIVMILGIGEDLRNHPIVIYNDSENKKAYCVPESTFRQSFDPCRI